jgi:HSP20 family molecular chaperone IbpA
MHERMERRRKEWEGEVERMRKDFFRLKPADTRRGSSDNLLDGSRNLNDIFYDDRKEGNKRFRVSFDVSQFRPDEISVRTQDQKLIVYAKHEEMGDGKSMSREFSRNVDIPKNVDSQKLQCTLSSDGILQIEAPVLAPSYDRIKENAHMNTPTAHAQHSPTSVSSFTSGPVISEQDGSRKFKIAVDIGADFEPQDLMVKTVDRQLIVIARHEEKLPGRTSCKEFSRKFDLPEHVDPNLVTASMTDGGKLLIEAPIQSYSQGSYTGKQGSTKQPTVTISFGK